MPFRQTSHLPNLGKMLHPTAFKGALLRPSQSDPRRHLCASVTPILPPAIGRCNKRVARSQMTRRHVRIGLRLTTTTNLRGSRPMSFSRRTLLKASAASAVLGGLGAPFVARAQTAEFTYKYANNLPVTHPLNVRAKEMAAAIKAETNGRVRPADLPEQPARLRHRHAEPGALRRRRVLHAVRPDPVDAGAGRLDQRHRLRVPGLRHGLEGDGRRPRRPCPRRDRQGRPRWSWTRSGTTASARSRRRASRSTGRTTSRASRSACRCRRCGPRCSRRSTPSPASINFSEVYSALQTKVVDGQENPLAHHLDAPSSTRCRSTAR